MYVSVCVYGRYIIRCGTEYGDDLDCGKEIGAPHTGSIVLFCTELPKSCRSDPHDDVWDPVYVRTSFSTTRKPNQICVGKNKEEMCAIGTYVSTI